MAETTLIPLPGARNTRLCRYFGFKSNDNKTILDKAKVFCKVETCDKPEIAYCGNTTALTDHLRRHVRENAEYLGAASPASPLAQSSISEHFGTPKKIDLESVRGRRLTGKIVNFLVKDLRPVSAVEGDGFIEMISAFAPDYPLASRMYYGRKISDRFTVAASRLQDRLKGMEIILVSLPEVVF